MASNDMENKLIYPKEKIPLQQWEDSVIRSAGIEDESSVLSESSNEKRLGESVLKGFKFKADKAQKELLDLWENTNFIDIGNTYLEVLNENVAENVIKEFRHNTQLLDIPRIDNSKPIRF